MQRTLVCFGLLFVIALAPAFEAFSQVASESRSGRSPAASKRSSTDQKGGFWENTSKWRQRFFPFGSEREADKKSDQQPGKKRPAKSDPSRQPSRSGQATKPVTTQSGRQSSGQGLVTMPAISGPPSVERTASTPRATSRPANPVRTVSSSDSRKPVALTSELQQGKSSRRRNRVDESSPASRQATPKSGPQRSGQQQELTPALVRRPAAVDPAADKTGRVETSGEVRVSDRAAGSAPVPVASRKNAAFAVSPRTAPVAGNADAGPTAAAAKRSEATKAARPPRVEIVRTPQRERATEKKPAASRPQAVKVKSESPVRGPSTMAPQVSRVNPLQTQNRLRPNTAVERKTKPTDDPRPARVATRLGSRTVGTELGGSLLFSKSPQLSVETLGPREVVIGKEATFKIRLQNLGDPVAESVLVRVNTPLGAQIVAAQASRGQTNAIAATKQKPLEWRIDRLESHEREFLTLRIVPRKSDAFDLGVTWTLAPIASQARIKVQEPKLTLEINGPHEIEYGDTKIYRLTITNPGNGVAENVQLNLKPLDGSGRPMAIRNLGAMEPGGKQVMEVELTARQEGYLNVEALAVADTDLQTSARQRVLVRRAQLAVSAKGPEMNYAGTTATYRFRVANQGNSSAENIRVVATLPTGGEYIESSNEGQWSSESRQVVWNIPALVAQNHQNFEVRASLSHPGENTFGVRLSAEDDLAATGEVVTMVEALADLQLVINDPRGPVPVEEETTYEVLISNRGTKAAEMVDVVVFFSEGIEPIAVSGGAAKVETGQVLFHPIEEIAPGEEVVYKITAHANRSGNHVFRTEVACEAADVRLVAEESTRFYGSSSARADTDEDSQRATPSADDQPDAPAYRRKKS